ncbi:MAG: TonB-dependent receptor [Gemmatimonadota bacterium]|nr:MAG: TonB-dependent receptor [Gemmatimonadota bacterium]
MTLLRTMLGVALLVTALGVPFSASAQSQATTGIIRGTITDPTGQPVAAARVDLVHAETGFTRSVTTNQSGIFAATLLPVGTYTVTVESLQFVQGITREGVRVRLGATANLDLSFEAVELEGISVTLTQPLVDASDVTSSARLSEEALRGLPNNGRDFLDLTLLTPGVGIVQGPDGEELTINGQRGIFNNVSVDGADFNNPFFGENRGGQRAAFTFNQDAIQEVVVINQGATAEFGRSAGGFVNVITKSGTNEFKGTVNYFGQFDEISADFARNGGNPNFDQNQFGFTLGGPIKRDKAFFFIAYDQQEFNQTKQVNRSVKSQGELNKLISFFRTEFGGALANDFGPISRTNDSKVLMAKLDVRLNENHNLSMKYNYTWSRQLNGTFDFDAWGASANAVERDWSNALNGSLQSQLSSSVSNEFRFQLSRENRPRPYGGPTNPATGRPFPDTGADFGDGFRWGMPFFIPIEDFDDRIQILNNTTILAGEHLIKFGVEWNRTRTKQTFIGFANGRSIFSSVDGFINFVKQGPTYVECSDGSSNMTGSCPAGTTITGPLQLGLQFAPVAAGTTVEDAGTQTITQNEFAVYLQDTWTPNRNVTVNYGLRWEAQVQPDPITPASQVFYRPFIGTANFPGDGNLTSDYGMFQPRFGVAWDVAGDGSRVFRVNAGIYYARIPGLVLASPRTTNGSIGANLFSASFLNEFGIVPPAYGELASSNGQTLTRPGVFVMDKDFSNPRTFSATVGYEALITDDLAYSVSYSFADTRNLFRFVDRNDAVFGSPFADFPGDATNGLGGVTVLESTARSRYQGVTVGLRGDFNDRVEFNVNYTVSWDKSDDDNERDPFSFRYARADRLDREYGFSDRDQRHRVNGFLLADLGAGFFLSNRVSYYSAQPTNEVCGAGNTGNGERAAGPGDRICADGSILRRNTLRKDNAFFTWDLRLSRTFDIGNGNGIELITEVFNLLNTDNFRDPAATSPLFNFDGTLQSGLGDPLRLQVGARYVFDFN